MQDKTLTTTTPDCYNETKKSRGVKERPLAGFFNSPEIPT